jgi:catechol 2,3-dioxygenase-like lactoylglutathione lyase family enzyme
VLRLQGIDHVALSVRDVGRSVAWYQAVLGLERRYADVWGDFPAVLGVGTTSLALFPAPVPEPAPPPGREVLSVRHIAFRVDRAAFAQARAELEAYGLQPRFEDHIAAHSLYITDPDGHQLEITTYEVGEERAQ